MRLSYLHLCIFVALSSQAFADDTVTPVSHSSEHSAELPKIVVTATRTPKTIAEIAGTVQTIAGTEIAQQSGAGRKVADILAQLVPSLAPSSGTTSNYGQTMRGRNVLVMIDGVPQTGSRDAARQLNSISPESIDHIEVVSGASSVYGSGATGGIINIISKRADPNQPVSFSTKVGLTSADNFRGDGLAYEVGQTASFNNDKMNAFLGVNYTSTGSQFDGKGDRISLSPWQGSTMDTNTLDVNGRLGFNLDDHQTLSLGAQYYKDKQDSDYGPDYSNTTSDYYTAKKGWNIPNQPFTERYGLNTQYQNTDFLGQTLNLDAYYRKEKMRFLPYYGETVKNGYTVKQSESENDFYGLRSTMSSDLSIFDHPLNLTYGIDYDHENDSQWADNYTASNNGLSYTATGISQSQGPDTHIDSIGAFTQADYALTDRFSVKGGVRYQYIQAKTDAYIPAREKQEVAGGKTDADKFLFNLGTVYKLTDAQQIFANFSQGFSYPDVQRMLRDVSTYNVTTANLQPISVNSYELGWRLQEDQGLNLAITGFYNTSDKSVQFSSRAAHIVNTDQRVYGAELNAKYQFLNEYSVGGTFAYTRGQYKDTSNSWHELNAFQVSPIKATLFADWNNDEGYGLRVQATAIKGSDKAYKDDLAFVAKGYRADDNNAAKIKGYTTMDVLAHFPAYKGTVNFGVYNVWNRQYKTVFAQQAAVTNSNQYLDIPAQGRTFALSYTLHY
ncbi:TonB-dependent receptor [Acinetobacter sp. MD2(2019)]|uniref:TonB-dependent receptor n=1 Tax=Acinetobacter sp. MD2(2019) TaxID=2605273 RepID=UPI002D1F0FE5|nr:TonB-dependent receptor [Acinetobacter sp. MD2(2019)]MEB3753542.1 TonB-dependent receptor [Acinetobacter sp. MD2(2019)]